METFALVKYIGHNHIFYRKGVSLLKSTSNSLLLIGHGFRFKLWKVMWKLFLIPCICCLLEYYDMQFLLDWTEIIMIVKNFRKSTFNPTTSRYPFLCPEYLHPPKSYS